MSIASSIGNNLTTNGVFTASAINNTSVNNITSFASVPGGGVLKLLSTQTASASASISFTSGIDSTYDSYVFKFIDLHPQNNNVPFQFNMSTDGGSNYNVTKTTTYFNAPHTESDSTAYLGYQTGQDLAQSTSDQYLMAGLGNADDENACGTLQIFNPSSSVFVKHFLFRGNRNGGNITVDDHVAGYGNTTAPINAIIFRMSSGNIDDGIIKMYGVV